MNFSQLPTQRLRNRDLALLPASPAPRTLTAEELALLSSQPTGFWRRFSPNSVGAAVSVLTFVIAVAGIEVAHRTCLHAARFSVEGMCCEFTAQTASERLEKLPRVVSVQPFYGAKTLEVKVRCQPHVSPRKLWEAVQNSELRPIALVYFGNTYREQPAF